MSFSDVIIIGSGVAALQLARNLRSEINVRIITKSHVRNGNSYLAQGGVAAALGEKDSPYQHYVDTIKAGRYHNDQEAVFKMTSEAPKLIQNLYASGCSFDKNERAELLLGMEGAHSEKRIVHGGGDATGSRIIDFLLSQLKKNVSITENVFVYDLLIDKQSKRCIGVKGKDKHGNIEYFYADRVVIATGGCGQLYSFTSNAETVTGDGLALAYRAGAELVDMEFVQFHPTLLFKDGKTRGLISEAVRGEGARLVTKDGIPFMDDVHPLKDLAPRHVVSQTIYDYLKKGEQIFLDIRMISHFRSRFPTITSLCERNGVSIEDGLLPVAPGSHFLMGGIKSDLYGRTSVNGLYAIGEAACTGIHGANRLASNSLLEGLVYGERLARLLNSDKSAKINSQLIPREFKSNFAPGLNLPQIQEMQTRMMDNAGIVRTKETLSEQKRWLESFDVHNWSYANLDKLPPEEIMKVFMLITSWLITDSALKRTESRGGHFRSDYPYEDDLTWKGIQIIQRRIWEEDEKDEPIKTAVAT
ncbi:L-aspartate oxidase [Bacillus methanolicus PB1]|uniref:L-aspartate oxidase n=1 Tax=Bacillus methanolicus PB1 TaxID=997296 RepID=I3DXQ1_BACMT|nr:L-aspartate oxidase [Bacillus methanolicus]EIJ79022.1 L-aspartate oxidase [Bacillus methanolicus PB1]